MAGKLLLLQSIFKNTNFEIFNAEFLFPPTSLINAIFVLQAVTFLIIVATAHYVFRMSILTFLFDERVSYPRRPDLILRFAVDNFLSVLPVISFWFLYCLLLTCICCNSPAIHHTGYHSIVWICSLYSASSYVSPYWMIRSIQSTLLKSRLPSTSIMPSTYSDASFFMWTLLFFTRFPFCCNFSSTHWIPFSICKPLVYKQSELQTQTLKGSRREELHVYSEL